MIFWSTAANWPTGIFWGGNVGVIRVEIGIGRGYLIPATVDFIKIHREKGVEIKKYRGGVLLILLTDLPISMDQGSSNKISRIQPAPTCKKKKDNRKEETLNRAKKPAQYKIEWSIKNGYGEGVVLL